jgi:uncharacterized membrane protein
VRRWDAGLITLNLALLMCIAFLPFPTAVLGTHISDAPAAVFYALSITVAGLFSNALWWYAARNHRLIRPDLPVWRIRLLLLRAVATPVVFLASIPAIPVRVGSIRLAAVIWVVALPAVRLVLSLTLRERTRS